MQKGKHITVRVTPEIYRQTRHLADQYETTVTQLVAYLLVRMPRALDQARFPVGGPKPASSSSAPASGLISQDTPHPPAQKAENSCCTAVSTLNSSVSEASSQQSGGRTAAVPPYDGRNQHNQNEFEQNCKSRTAAGLRSSNGFYVWHRQENRRLNNEYAFLSAARNWLGFARFCSELSALHLDQARTGLIEAS